VILNASSRFDENGNLINTRGSVLNITERKRSEQEIERIFNTTGYMICVANMEGYFKRINSSFEQTLGYSTKELLKQPFFEFIHPDDIEKTKAVIAEKLSRGVQVIGFENRYRCKDGSYKWLSWTSRPIVEEGVMYAIAYDITARKEAEQATYKLNKELEAKNKELESILYAASHDLKSPLVNIQGFGYELSKNYDLIRSALSSRTKVNNIDKAVNIALNEDIPNALDFISASSVKMDSLLSGLLDYCRLGTAVMNIRNIDMNTMMTDVSGNMEYQIKEAKAEVDIEPLLPCLGDPAQINRVFTNLLTNALKFLDESRPGKIRIYCSSQDSHSIYCIEDNGIGIAPEHHEEIFEIFYQLEPEKRKGDGLGLTIVKRIIDRHNGKIWIESEKGKGSKIFVSLPNA
jgi:PAS domain S-box-containing protein